MQVIDGTCDLRSIKPSSILHNCTIAKQTFDKHLCVQVDSDHLGELSLSGQEHVFSKGLFTYYVSQKQGFLHPPSPLRQQWSAFG